MSDKDRAITELMQSVAILLKADRQDYEWDQLSGTWLCRWHFNYPTSHTAAMLIAPDMLTEQHELTNLAALIFERLRAQCDKFLKLQEWLA